jgi:hypothetical protein
MPKEVISLTQKEVIFGHFGKWLKIGIFSLTGI